MVHRVHPSGSATGMHIYIGASYHMPRLWIGRMVVQIPHVCSVIDMPLCKPHLQRNEWGFTPWQQGNHYNHSCLTVSESNIVSDIIASGREPHECRPTELCVPLCICICLRLFIISFLYYQLMEWENIKAAHVRIKTTTLSTHTTIDTYLLYEDMNECTGSNSVPG